MKRWHAMIAAAGCALAISLGGGTAVAQSGEPKLVGTFGDWSAYTTGNGKNRFCYMISTPQEASLRSRRGEIFAYIWHRPGDRQFDVVQVDIGYRFKSETVVQLSIDGKAWELFFEEQRNRGNAWSYDDDEPAIVRAMRRGKRMAVKGVSSRNNPTTDVYSLRGVTAAHNAINRACKRSS